MSFFTEAPDTVWGMIAVVGGLLVLQAGSWIDSRRQSTSVGQIHEQVVNEHGPGGKDRNLREDIDDLLELSRSNAEAIAEMRGSMATKEDVGELRGELTALRRRVDQMTTPSRGW